MNALDEPSRGLPAQATTTEHEVEELTDGIAIPATAEINPVSVSNPLTATAPPVPEPVTEEYPAATPTELAVPVTADSAVMNRDDLHTNPDGSIELLEELFEDFESRCPELMGDIKQHIADGNAEGLQFSSHTLKGVVAIFGAEASRDTAKRLEDMARENDLTPAAEVFAQLESEMRLLGPEIKKVIEEGW